MKFLKWAGAHLRDACIYFTVFQFAVTAIFQLTAENGGRGQFLIFGVELAVFAFSFALACAADILKIKKISLPLRILIHFLCCIAAVSLLFIVLGFALIYIVIAAAALLILHVKNKKISDDSEYESMFKGKKE